MFRVVCPLDDCYICPAHEEDDNPSVIVNTYAEVREEAKKHILKQKEWKNEDREKLKKLVDEWLSAVRSYQKFPKG